MTNELKKRAGRPKKDHKEETKTFSVVIPKRYTNQVEVRRLSKGYTTTAAYVRDLIILDIAKI